MKRRWMCAVTLFFGLALAAGEPPSQPILRMETGMHSAMIRRLAVDGSGRTLATASEDKTLRLWDTDTGELLSTVRPPAGAGSEGMLKCCAFSPDAKLVAVGGWTGWEWDGTSSIYLVEVATGRILRRLTGLPSLPYRLAYARDGRLVACLWSGGIRVFRPDGSEAFRDADYGDQCYGADFDRSGRLVTSCWDGFLRLYGPEGQVQAKVAVGGQPFSVRFSSDGTRVAVGFDQALKVEVRSGLDLTLLLTPDAKGTNGSLFTVAWSPDGQTLYAAGSFASAGFRQVRAWPGGGRGAATDFPTKAEDSIMDMVALPDRRLVWSSADPAWGVLGGISRTGSIANFKRTPLAVDPAGTRVAFGYSWLVERPAVFDVPARELKAGPAPDLQAPRTTAPGMELTGWKHAREPKLNGHPLTLEKYENSRSVALNPQGGVLLGADWNLYTFDAEGKKRWGVPSPGAAWAVNVSQDGVLGIAAYGDGTIRWHRMSDGKELLAFFPHLDGRRWVAWTPSGYYDASPGGEDLIGWQLNHGKEGAADFFPASRFRAQYDRPDIVAQVLSSLDEGVAVQVANAGRRQDTFVLERALPPVVRILDPQQGARMEGPVATLRASVRHPRGAPIDAVWAAVDGRRVETRGLRPQQDQASDQIYTLEVPLPTQDCLVSVFARSGSAVSEAATVRLLSASRAPLPGPLATQLPVFAIQPKLYVLAIGVGAYQRADLALDYPAKDARDFARAMEAQKSGLYRDVEMKVLTDAEATRDAVEDGLEWLEHQVTAKDVAVVFLAGHGINDTGGQYYFLPSNADPDRIKRTMVADSDVRSTLAKLPGKVVLFLDTCHAGNILGGVKQRGSSDLNGFINELSSAESGVVVFSASTGRQSSQESREWGNGAFTKAVVEGLSGKADFQHTGRVTLNMLDLYISERVKELTRGTQSPTTAKPNTVQDFPLAVVK